MAPPHPRAFQSLARQGLARSFDDSAADRQIVVEEVLDEAIEAATDGDQILVGPGEYVLSRPIDFNPGEGGAEGPVVGPVEQMSTTYRKCDKPVRARKAALSY